MKHPILLTAIFLFVAGSVTLAQAAEPELCRDKAEAVRQGLSELRASAVTQEEDLAEIRSSYESLVETIRNAPDRAMHARMELDVRLEAFKVRSKENAGRIKELHSRIARLMKCHGFKPPRNGVMKAVSQ